MKLASLVVANREFAARIDGDLAIEIGGCRDVGDLLRQKDWRETAESANGASWNLDALAGSDWAAVVPRPSKVICVGLNYREHITEMGMRDYQYRTTEWFQGKTFEGTTPLGPMLVTPDEMPSDPILTILVDDEVVQSASVNAGVGHGRDPRRYLADGSEVRTQITGIGELRNRVRHLS